MSNEFVLTLDTGSDRVEIGRFPDAFSLYAYLGNVPHQTSHSMSLNQEWPEAPISYHSDDFKIGQEYWIHESYLGTRKGRTAKKNRVVLDCVRPEVGRQYIVFRGVNKNGTPSNSSRQITHIPFSMLRKMVEREALVKLDSRQENYQPLSETTGKDFYYDAQMKAHKIPAPKECWGEGHVGMVSSLEEYLEQNEN